MTIFLAKEAVFTGLDWAVLVGYFIFLAVIGYIFTSKQKNTDDYFLGGRSMPLWAVALSVLATSQSAATFLGGPEYAFKGDLSYLASNIGPFIAVAVIVCFFIPRFYAKKITTVYELLEDRGGLASRSSASVLFMIGRIFASGARLMAAAIAGAMILFSTVEVAFWQVSLSVLLFAFIGTAYSFAGGIKTVIWTDAIQTVVYLGAAVVSLIYLINLIPGNLSEIYAVLEANDKLDMIKPETVEGGIFTFFSAKNTFSITAICVGLTLFNIGAYGTDQDLAQRMMTCKNSWQSSMSLIVAIIIGLPILALFMFVGHGLYIFYKSSEIMGDQLPQYATANNLKIFLQFILVELHPGMKGIMLAGLMAAGLSSFNSAINAMSSTFVNDLYKPFFNRNKARKTNLSEEQIAQKEVRFGRIMMVVWAIALSAFGCLGYIWYLSTEFDFLSYALGVMVFAYAPLTGVFFAVIFTSRGNAFTIISAIIAGFTLTWLWQPFIYNHLVATQPEYKLAFPWQMALGVAICFLITIVGKAPTRSNNETTASTA